MPRFSEYPELATLADDDVLLVKDASAGTTKHATIETLATGIAGRELAYAEITSAITGITALSAAPADLAGLTITLEADGVTPIMLEAWVYSALCTVAAAPGKYVAIELREGTNPLSAAILHLYDSNKFSPPGFMKRRIVPSAGEHTYKLVAYVSSTSGGNTGTVYAFSSQPTYIRATTVNIA